MTESGGDGRGSDYFGKLSAEERSGATRLAPVGSRVGPGAFSGMMEAREGEASRRRQWRRRRSTGGGVGTSSSVRGSCSFYTRLMLRQEGMDALEGGLEGAALGTRHGSGVTQRRSGGGCGEKKGPHGKGEGVKGWSTSPCAGHVAVADLGIRAPGPHRAMHGRQSARAGRRSGVEYPRHRRFPLV
jgi:hypothetical protein